jgi:ABC-2 type transport system permease protein
MTPRGLGVVWSSARLHFQILAVERFAYVIFIAQPLMVAIASIYMLRHRPDFEAIYVVVGTALTGLWSQTLLFGTGAINGDRMAGLLSYFEAAPASFFAVVSGRTLGYLGFSITSAVVGYAVAVGLFGYSLSVAHPPQFAVSVVLTVASLWSVGMLLAPVTLRWVSVGMLMGGLEYPLYIFCAFLFPLSILPGWLHPVSYALPPYWGAVALHASSTPSLETADVYVAWALLTVTSLLAAGLARLLFEVMLRYSRERGMLDAY